MNNLINLRMIPKATEKKKNYFNCDLFYLKCTYQIYDKYIFFTFNQV